MATDGGRSLRRATLVPPGGMTGSTLTGFRLGSIHDSSTPESFSRIKMKVNRKADSIDVDSADMFGSLGPGAKESAMNAGKLEEQITNDKLRNLQRLFEEADEDGGGGLDIDEFRNAMQQTMPGVDAHELEIIFMKVDTNCDGTVDWDEYLSYMLLEYKEKDQMTSMLMDKPLPKPLREIQSNHRDDICRIAFLPSLLNKQGNSVDKTDFLHGRYITISRDGVVNFWSLEMNHLKTNVLDYAKEKTLWVTDLVCLANVSMIAISSTERDISLFDINANKFDRSYRISGLDHCPLTMDYWFDRKDMNNAVLIWGDVGGNVCAIVYKECMSGGGPFGNYPGKKGPMGQRIPFGELLKGVGKGITAHKLTGLHDDWISQIRFFPTLDCFISCCVSGATSMYVGDLEQKKVTSYFVNRKGILCFDYDSVSNIIVTGGMDHLVRVWNPYVNSKAIVVFKGHNKAVVHVVINSEKEQVISIAKDKTIRVYNLSDQSCAQNVPGNKVAMGPHAITSVFLNTRLQCLILGTNQLAIFERKDEERQQEVKTHNAPITAALYNKLFNQVVIGCHESTVSVWDLYTGEKVIQFTNAHKIIEKGEEKGIEITAMTFDPTGRRLITGARDGTVKMWNFNNGACLREIETLGGREITGLVCPRQRIVISGWNRRVTSYIDAKDMEDEAPKIWDLKHHDDILSMAYNRSSSLATGSYDGDVIIWSLETGHILCRLNAQESTFPQTVVRPIRQIKRASALKSMEDSGSIMSTQSIPRSEPEKQPSINDSISKKRKKKKKVLLPASASSSRTEPTDNYKLPDINRGENSLVSSPLCQNGSIGKADVSSLADVQRNAREDDNGRLYTAEPSFLGDDENENEGSMSVDNVLFLTRREVGIHTATFVTGGGEGWVRAWSVHHKGGLLGQYVAVLKPGESVTSMIVDPRNEFLLTGDSDGYVKVWDISDYCISDEQFAKIFPGDREQLKEARQKRFPYVKFDKHTKDIRNRNIPYGEFPTPTKCSDPSRTMKVPLLLSSFRAHLKTVTSLEHIEERDLVITSSSDCSVRLWTLCGRYIGTFGQKRLWDIKCPCPPQELPYCAPNDVRKVASAGTLRVFKGGMKNRWMMARNIVLLWMMKSKIGQDSPDVEEKKDDHKVPEPVEEEQTPSDTSSILGKFYQPKVRHKISPKLTPVKQIQNQVVVYSSLPYSELAPVDEIETPQVLQDIQKRYQLSMPRDQGPKFGQKVRTVVNQKRLLRAFGPGSIVASSVSFSKKRQSQSTRKISNFYPQSKFSTSE